MSSQRLHMVDFPYASLRFLTELSLFYSSASLYLLSDSHIKYRKLMFSISELVVANLFSFSLLAIVYLKFLFYQKYFTIYQIVDCYFLYNYHIFISFYLYFSHNSSSIVLILAFHVQLPVFNLCITRL